MSQSKKSLVPGIILITVGGLFLLNQLDLFYFRWWHLYPLILLTLGGLVLISVFTNGKKSAAFPGTVLMSLGLFFFLRNYGYFRLDDYFWYPDEFWPIFLIALGLGFMALYLVKPEDWAVLVPGGVLIFVGVLFMLRNLRIVRWADFGDFWPVILIALGLGIAIRSRRKKLPNASEPSAQN